MLYAVERAKSPELDASKIERSITQGHVTHLPSSQSRDKCISLVEPPVCEPYGCLVLDHCSPGTAAPAILASIMELQFV